ncbi:MAG: LptF/LptG family permease [Candidatus Electryoneaceae bacterium]|nr:LptF/LptG family permease [Candidatus Electryoneaceae bacterium]
MRILDRYIVANYVKSLIWAIVAAIVVFLVVDIVERLDKFIDKGVPAATVAYYYYLYIPYIIYLTMPVATLLATLFTVGGMVKTNELTAMHVSGISFGRVLMLLLTTAALTATGVFFLGETIVPKTNQERMDIYRYVIKGIPRESRSKVGRLYLQLNSSQQLYIDHYNPPTREAFDIELIETAPGRLMKRMDAEKMVWRDEQWLVQGAVEREFQPNGSVRWNRNDTLIVSGAGLRPNELEKIQTAPEEMNWTELKEFIQRLRNSGSGTLKWEVELLSKVSLPAAAVIIVLFGAPMAAIKQRGGTALGFGLSLFVCFIYFGFIQIGKVMGYNGSLPPIVSAWIGNVFFGLLGVTVLIRKG